MNKKVFMPWICFAVFIVFGWCFTGSEILQKVDERTVGRGAPSDIEMKMTMKIFSPSGSEKVREMKTWNKNVEGEENLRLMKFISPPDVRNVGFLSLSGDQMYLYLPEFHRVRRIASHNKADRFMGSDYSYDDLASGSFQKHYHARLLSENESSWLLELTRKPEADKPYAKIEMRISKESHLPTNMRLYDFSGNLWKEAEQENKKMGKYWIPVRMSMKDVKDGSRTELVMEDIKTDQGLDENIFTTRVLKRRVR